MSAETQQYSKRIGVITGDMYLVDSVLNHLRGAVDKIASTYPEEVVDRVVNIIERSFRNLFHHNESEFISYGEFWILDSIVRQVWADYKNLKRSRPQIVVLYGPPGTGKTTWVRQVAKKFLSAEFFLRGLYLEVTPGDFSSKYAGVPIAMLKSLFELVSTDKVASILLFDEADGFLMRPQDASGGIEIEQQRLVAEIKSSLSVLLSRPYPVVVVMTTNFKDAIIRADPAIGDRVTAWIEVPHPPPDVREKMVRKLLPPVFAELWGSFNPYAQAHAFRALHAGAELPLVDPRRTRVNGYRFRIPWIVPVLPFDANYLVGYLVAWGWNPLDEEVLPALQLDFNTAAALWDESNPLLAVYARGLLTELEMLRKHNEEKHGVGKSFLRTFYLLKSGVENFTKIVLLSYSEFWSKVDATYKEMLTDKETLEKEYNRLSRSLSKSLMVHGVPPSLLHHAVSKVSASQEFVRVVNRVLVTASITANALRQLYLPFLASYHEDPLLRFIDLRQRLGDYNRFLARELTSGRLLEPLRVLLTVQDEEKAWAEAKRSLSDVDEELRPLIGLAVLPAKVCFRAIHSKDTEQKGAILYEIFKDPDGLMNTMYKIAEELGAKEWMPSLLDEESFPAGGITITEDLESWYIYDATLFNMDIARESSRAYPYAVVSLVSEPMGHYILILIDQIENEMKEKEKNKNNMSR